jgi:hypothetical protein
VVVHGEPLYQPEDAVLRRHVGDGDPERDPVLVEGDDADTDEVEEVRLDEPAGEVGEDGTDGHERPRAEGGPSAAR